MNIKLFELKKIQTNFVKQKITSSKQSYDFIKQFYSDDLEIFESVFILMLNRANETIGYSKISQGGICGTVIDVKILAKYVIDSLASSVILAHNHPSGNLQPSKADEDITIKIKAAASYFDITVIDHIIVSEEGFYSFAKSVIDDNMINNNF